jgi:hypothetical protein
MIGPIVDEAAVTPTAKSASYFASRIALISIAPRPPASATAAPDIPAKITEAPTFTWPRPPRIQPISALANSKIRSVIPAVFMRLPARIKNGTASSGNESTPFIMRWATTISGTVPKKMMKRAEDPARAIATGTPIAIMPNSSTKRMTMSKCVYSARGARSACAAGSIRGLVPVRQWRHALRIW